MQLARGQHLTVAQREPTRGANGRGWSWAALVAGLVVYAAGLPTFGLSIVFAPLPAILSLVAWKWSRHDVVFWIGFALNALLMLSLVALVVSILIGETGFG